MFSNIWFSQVANTYNCYNAVLNKHLSVSFFFISVALFECTGENLETHFIAF